MRVALIEPNAGLWAPGRFTRHSSFEPIGLEYLAAFLEAAGHTVRVFQQRDQSESNLLASILRAKPAVVGFSTMTFNVDLALHLSKRIKQLAPKTITVLGGYHPSANPEIVTISPDIDYVVTGEGEATLAELLSELAKPAPDVSRVQGIAFNHGRLVVNPIRPRIANLDDLPWPKRSRSTLKECRVNSIAYPPPSKQKSVAQVVWSRGCPYSCPYCVSAAVWQRQVRYRSAADVAKEISFLQKRYGTNLVFFTDLTFNLNEGHMAELCTELQRRCTGINWFCMCHMDLFNARQAEMMKEAGCSKIAFGVETFEKGVRDQIKPRTDNAIGRIREKLQICDAFGLLTRVYLMIGHPDETPTSLSRTIGHLRSLPVDDIKLSFLTPFPGTALYSEIKNSLITTDLSRFTTDEPIIINQHLTGKVLIAARARIAREFYTSAEYKSHAVAKSSRFPALRESYEEFEYFLKSMKVIP